MHSTYVITGGAGFVGTNLATHLCDNGDTVVVLDDLSGGADPKRLPKAVQFHAVDIRDTKAVSSLSTGADAIFHLAAWPRVQRSIDDPQSTHDINLNGTLSVLEAARAAKVPKVVYAASSAMYGDQDIAPLHEGLPAQPKSPYGLQKYMGEGLMKLWSELYGLETVSFRFFNVYGPHMDPDGAYALVVGKFLKLRLEGKTLTITGDGEQTRDFVHVQDLVRALTLAGACKKPLRGEVYNVGSGSSVSINTLAELIGGEVAYIPARIEPIHTLADIAAIEKAFGWKPEITIETGIAALRKGWGV